MSLPYRKETKADTQASSIDKEKSVNNGVATLDSVDNTDNSNSLPATTAMPIAPTSAKRNIFSGMAPLHRPEFDSLVNIVITNTDVI